MEHAQYVVLQYLTQCDCVSLCVLLYLEVILCRVCVYVYVCVFALRATGL